MRPAATPTGRADDVESNLESVMGFLDGVIAKHKGSEQQPRSKVWASLDKTIGTLEESIERIETSRHWRAHADRDVFEEEDCSSVSRGVQTESSSPPSLSWPSPESSPEAVNALTRRITDGIKRYFDEALMRHAKLNSASAHATTTMRGQDDAARPPRSAHVDVDLDNIIPEIPSLSELWGLGDGAAAHMADAGAETNWVKLSDLVSSPLKRPPSLGGGVMTQANS